MVSPVIEQGFAARRVVQFAAGHALWLCLAMTAMSAPGAVPASGPPVFLGYAYGRANGLSLERLTHVCHAFVEPGEDGRIQRNLDVPNHDLVDRAHKADVPVLLSVGGWGLDEKFAMVVSNHQSLERCVAGLTSLVAEYDYDGIDLNWEYPDTKEEIAGFERFVRQLRAELDELAAKRGKPMLMTIAASANPGTLRWLDGAFLLSAFDWVNVMTYDYAGEWSTHAGHNAPLFASSHFAAESLSVERTVRYLLEERKLPPQRIVLGLPLYGRGFAVAEPYQSTAEAPAPKHGSVAYAGIADLMTHGWRRRWDDDTKTPWLLAPDGSEVFGYDDAESLAGKTTWAMNLGLRGVFFWELRQDLLPDGTNPLQQAAHDAWSAAGSTQLP
jgi:chitinase